MGKEIPAIRPPEDRHWGDGIGVSFTTSGQRLSSGGGVRFHLVPAAAPRQP
jgi:hypothetical protein